MVVAEDRDGRLHRTRWAAIIETHQEDLQETLRKDFYQKWIKRTPSPTQTVIEQEYILQAIVACQRHTSMTDLREPTTRWDRLFQPAVNGEIETVPRGTPIIGIDDQDQVHCYHDQSGRISVVDPMEGEVVIEHQLTENRTLDTWFEFMEDQDQREYELQFISVED